VRRLFLRVIVFAFLASLALTTAVAQAPKAKRINRGIELLSRGQPIYYTGSHSGTDGSFEQGKRDAQTYADYISYDMEHAQYDIKGLADYPQKADAWPLNPDGELLFGLKLEDKCALENAEQNLKVPGIAFAEWGPGDMSLSLGVLGPNAERDPRMQAARRKL